MNANLTDKQKALYANTFGVLDYIDNEESLAHYVSLKPQRVVDAVAHAMTNGIIERVPSQAVGVLVRATISGGCPPESTIRAVIGAYREANEFNNTVFVQPTVNNVFIPYFSDDLIEFALESVFEIYPTLFDGRKYIGENIRQEPFRALSLYFDNWDALAALNTNQPMVISKSRIEELSESVGIQTLIESLTKSCNEVISRGIFISNPDTMDSGSDWSKISTRLYPIFDLSLVVANAPVKDVGFYIITNNVQLKVEDALSFLARLRKLKPTSVDKYYEIMSKLINVISKSGNMSDIADLEDLRDSLRKHALDYFRKSHQLKYPSAHNTIVGEVTEADLSRHWELVVADALEQLIEAQILDLDVLYELVTHMMDNSKQFYSFIMHFEDRYSNIVMIASVKKIGG